MLFSGLFEFFQVLPFLFLSRTADHPCLPGLRVHRVSKSDTINPGKRNPSGLLNTKTPPFEVPELLVREGWDSILGRFHTILSLVLYSSLTSALGHCWKADSGWSASFVRSVMGSVMFLGSHCC